MTVVADFDLPPGLEAGQPPEARGLARDDVRLLVAGDSGLRHARFSGLGQFLSAGDVLVINTSATLAAAVDGRRPDGSAVIVHFSTLLDDGSWLVELRPPGRATGPVTDAQPGERIGLPAGAALTLSVPAPRTPTMTTSPPCTTSVMRRGVPPSAPLIRPITTETRFCSGSVRGSHSISISTSGICWVSEARYCLVQRSTWRAK